MGYEAYDNYYPELTTATQSFQRTLTFGANAGDVILCFVEHDANSTDVNQPTVSSTNISWSIIQWEGSLNGEGQCTNLYRGKVTNTFSANTETVTVAWNDTGDGPTYKGAIFSRWSPSAGKVFVTEPVNVSADNSLTAPVTTGTDGLTVSTTTTGSNSFLIVGMCAMTTAVVDIDLASGTGYTQAVETFRQLNATNHQPFNIEHKTQASSGSVSATWTYSGSDTGNGAWVAIVALEEVVSGAYDPATYNMSPYYRTLLST